MIIIFTNYYDQTQAIGLQGMLSYSGYSTPYPLLISLSKSVEYGVSLSRSVEFGINLSKSVEYEVSLSKVGGGIAT